MLERVRVAGEPNDPTGFSIVKDNELYQLYVARTARGSGVAAALVADAERRIKRNGAKIAWLACAIGNERAARFYEKCGWRRVGTMVSQLETAKGIVPLEVWRYEILTQ
jgi:GNAT superfamily N-acetyltransferase